MSTKIQFQQVDKTFASKGRPNFQIPHMYFGIITTTLLGLAFATALLWIERRFTSWKAPAPD